MGRNRRVVARSRQFCQDTDRLITYRLSSSPFSPLFALLFIIITNVPPSLFLFSIIVSLRIRASPNIDIVCTKASLSPSSSNSSWSPSSSFLYFHLRLYHQYHMIIISNAYQIRRPDAFPQILICFVSRPRPVHPLVRVSCLEIEKICFNSPLRA